MDSAAGLASLVTGRWLEAEAAKRKLSKDKKVKVEISAIMDGIDFKETLTRAKFEELNKDLFKKWGMKWDAALKCWWIPSSKVGSNKLCERIVRVGLKRGLIS